MRLADAEITIIKDIIQGRDVRAKVYLFGSRADDSKRGGDIDILIMSERLTNEDRDALRLRLYEAMGEQKIDIIIAKDRSDPFVRIALEKGVAL